ncbi:hypothetical protein E2562_019962 [Oryza meyeriana var. granulata]|nr:hypothetical protein E2562_019962 [Oryza meyeriana var. granulata]
MQYLTLAINSLSGPLPKEFGKLTDLRSLGIGSNNFTGELPEELGNLTKLEQLYIDSSGFSGPFPSTFSKLKNLKTLWGSDNDFTGEIPDYLGSLTKLEELRFQGNSFQGPIPASFSNLTNLTGLRIGDIVNGSSSLTFISNLTSLNVLILRNCKISDNLGTRFFIQPTHGKLSFMGYPEQFAITWKSTGRRVFDIYVQLGGRRDADRCSLCLFFLKHSLNLDWPTRFEIILGIARGLTYLHEESSVRIVHRDIKASNVLLDTDLTPKISDFGLAKLYDEKKTHISTKIAGTFGYLAPEYAMRGHLTEKADVFAFGVVALETVAGRSNTDNSLENEKIYLFEWAWGLYEREQAIGIVDPKLDEFDSEEAFRVISVALLCTQGSPHQRPPMSRVMAILTGDIEITEVVTKPSYITEWQLRGGNTSYVTSTNYSGSTTGGELREQREIDPLTPSPTITGVTYDGR